MIEITGKHNTAKVFTDTADEATKKQIETLCDQEAFKDSKIRIMPDCHAGKGATIGTAMTIKDKVIPSAVGVDINCGMLVVEIGDKKIDLQRLDKCVHRAVPHGSGVHSAKHPHRWADRVDLSELRCKDHIKWQNQHLAIGTLGSGNHFVSVEVGSDEIPRLIIHTGSRNLGLQVAEYYQQAAFDALHGKDSEHKAAQSARRREIVEKLTAEGRQKEISDALKELFLELSVDDCGVPFEYCYCEGQLFDDYLHDMNIAQEFATVNREAIADEIQCGMRWKVLDQWETRHNYIDLDNMILRKGAISAQKGEIAIIPMNMRDGSLIVRGKGNPDWNYSAPHGAGRIMSRTEARNSLAMKDYKESMEGIFTTCISSGTIDEAPQAYKPMDEIVRNIEPACDIIDVIKPIYNFKAQ